MEKIEISHNFLLFLFHFIAQEMEPDSNTHVYYSTSNVFFVMGGAFIVQDHNFTTYKV
jgi:hypothetical protein